MNIHIKDALVILPDGAEICSVFVMDGEISSTTSPPDGFVADKIINGTGKMLIPGLVNAHSHAAMTVFRNCADDLLFNEWLFNRIFPLEEKLCGDDVYWGVSLAVMEMLRSGTTSFLDMYSFGDYYAKAVEDSGIRCVFSLGILGDHSVVQNKLREALDLCEKYSGIDNLSFMLAPHAPYTCDEGFQREVGAEAKRKGLGIHTHISESLAESDTIKERYGCTSSELFDKTGLLTDKTVAAHCVHLTDSDINLLAERGVSVATNPVSNLKLANGIAPVPKLIKAGVNVALGTDGAASNNALNLFRELAFLTTLHKGINHDAQAINAREGFNIATKNGAAALGYKNSGEIKPGYKADLVLLDLDRPNMRPLNNPVAALAYSANGSEVETVIVGGKILMENREFTTIDSERVNYEINKICERLGT